MLVLHPTPVSRARSTGRSRIRSRVLGFSLRLRCMLPLVRYNCTVALAWCNGRPTSSPRHILSSASQSSPVPHTTSYAKPVYTLPVLALRPRPRLRISFPSFPTPSPRPDNHPRLSTHASLYIRIPESPHTPPPHVLARPPRTRPSNLRYYDDGPAAPYKHTHAPNPPWEACDCR